MANTTLPADSVSTTQSITSTTLSLATTTAKRAGGLSIQNIIIIISSLGFICIVLAIILIYLGCKRKSAQQDISSVKNTSSTYIVTGMSDPQTDENAEYVSPSPNIDDTYAVHIDMSPGTGSSVPSATMNAAEERHLTSTDSSNPLVEYINISEHYENFNTGQRRPAPIPNDDSSPPALPPHRRRSGDEKSLERGHNIFRTGTKAYHLYINALQDYEMSRDDLKLQHKLGKGHFGTVFSGIAAKLPHSDSINQEVAIKTMRGTATDSDKQEFLYEYEIMKLTNTLKHANITQMLGSVTKSQPCMIVLELMTNGNLRSYLRATRTQDEYYNLHGNSSCLSEHQLLQFALDIANGMEGISDLQLLHRDLAARNILLDENLTCKIADFGFAKDVLNKPQYKSKSVFQRPRPTRWLAPESLLQFKHSILSDVWSYGIVLWEIVTLGNLPYPNMKKPSQVQHAISQGYRMPCPKHCSPDIYRVMTCCWEEKPNKRPAFPQLVDKMRQLLQQATYLIDIGKIEDDNDYIEVLPPDEQEVLLNYESEETLA